MDGHEGFRLSADFVGCHARMLLQKYQVNPKTRRPIRLESIRRWRTVPCGGIPRCLKSLGFHGAPALSSDGAGSTPGCGSSVQAGCCWNRSGGTHRARPRISGKISSPVDGALPPPRVCRSLPPRDRAPGPDPTRKGGWPARASSARDRTGGVAAPSRPAPLRAPPPARPVPGFAATRRSPARTVACRTCAHTSGSHPATPLQTAMSPSRWSPWGSGAARGVCLLLTASDAA